jgi:steroid 5-alpha reductase family enzyme
MGWPEFSLLSLIAVLGFMTLVWAVSVQLRNASVVDVV